MKRFHTDHTHTLFMLLCMINAQLQLGPTLKVKEAISEHKHESLTMLIKKTLYSLKLKDDA